MPGPCRQLCTIGGGRGGGRARHRRCDLFANKRAFSFAQRGGEEGGRAQYRQPPPPSAPKGKETKAAFKQRLRRAAMATSTRTVRRALLSIKKRAQAIFDADGGDIDFD